MPSTSYRRWTTTRAAALDEIEQAHASVGGTGRGRRYATLQLNYAYTVLLASQFQGFCRDLHSECIDELMRTVAAPPLVRSMVRAEFARNIQLSRGNAQPSSLSTDFRRLGLDLWGMLETHDPTNTLRRRLLEELNDWRNAIAHQDFDPAKFGGRTTLRLAQVQLWRRACRHLARGFDEVMRRHLQTVTGNSPW